MTTIGEVTGLNRINGRVIKISKEKGWGFISSFDKPFTRIFFHWSALEPTFNILNLNPGAKVEFEPMEIPEKGWRAMRIKVIENGKPAETPSQGEDMAQESKPSENLLP